jgi:hypothetical protein
MFSKCSAVLAIVIVLSYCIGSSSCANIVPPGGGPKDSLPPFLLTALPKDSAINVSSNKFTLTFNEFVELKEINQNLVVSPLPKNIPIVDYKLRNVTVKLKDSLLPNTTYSINFGNAIKDITEGNVLKNFTYVFSTGSTIAQGTINGKVTLAKTGKIDSTLIVVLYKNLNDTAVVKTNPLYMSKLDGSGNFTFNFIQPGMYNVFAMPNEYNKRYNDSTQLFAFLDSSITISNTANTYNLFAFQEAEKKEKSTSAGTTVQPKLPTERNTRLRISADESTVDLISKKALFSFSKPVVAKYVDSVLLVDTNHQPLPNTKIVLDSTKKKLIVLTAWQPGAIVKLIVPKNAFTDTAGNSLYKTDTLKLSVKNEFDYGSLKLRFTNLDTAKRMVVLIMKEEEIAAAYKLQSKEISEKLFLPGDYEIRILYDTNNNGIWDAGNYKQKKQPEKVYSKNLKLQVRANWDNETTIALP